MPKIGAHQDDLKGLLYSPSVHLYFIEFYYKIDAYRKTVTIYALYLNTALRCASILSYFVTKQRPQANGFSAHLTLLRVRKSPLL